MSAHTGQRPATADGGDHAPRAGGRRILHVGLPVILVGIAALAIALTATYALTSLRQYADERRQAEVLLARLEARANQQGALNWQAIGEEALSRQLTDQVLDVRGRMAEAVNELSWLDRGGDVLSRANAVLDRYHAAVSDALGLLAEGDVAGAENAMRTRVTPAFEELDDFITSASSGYGEGAAQANSSVTIASALTMLSAAILIALLFRKFERARRNAARIDGERRVLEASELRFRSLVQNSSDAITVTAPDGVIAYQSASVERLIGYRAPELAGTALMDLVHPDDRAAGRRFLASAVSEPNVTAPLEWRLRHRGGRWVHIETIANNLIDDPNVRGIVLNSRDLSERKALEQQLSHQALHDPLTDLPNRLLFKERLAEAMARAGRSPRRVAVMFLDLDDFKVVNDTLGHAAGDELLTALAGRLAHSLREDDLAARLAGDEFAVLLESDDDVASAATAAAERLKQALAAPFGISGQIITVRVSVGIAVGEGDEAPDDLLRNADVAMYAAKAAGKGRYEMFEPRMRTLLLDRVEMEAELKAAVEGDELDLHYQPIVELKTGRLVGVEALARWTRGGRGVVMPSTFIPLAEQSGLIVPLGRWVFRRACRQFSEWRARYDVLDDCTLSVNLSPAQLQAPELVDDVRSALEESGLDPSRVVIEITEGAMVDDAESGIGVLRRLKDVGVRIAIDDFGTGYSSLSHLSRFPVDVLKIDKSFLGSRDLRETESEAALANAVIMLARALHLTAVAEGVERQDQLDALIGLGCELGQGMLFSPPLSPAAFESGLENGRLKGGAPRRLPRPATA